MVFFSFSYILFNLITNVIHSDLCITQVVRDEDAFSIPRYNAYLFNPFNFTDLLAKFDWYDLFFVS